MPYRNAITAKAHCVANSLAIVVTFQSFCFCMSGFGKYFVAKEGHSTMKVPYLFIYLTEKKVEIKSVLLLLLQQPSGLSIIFVYFLQVPI